MKRELKGYSGYWGRSFSGNRKADPDEKGTESFQSPAISRAVPDRKADPDEKGTERYYILTKAFRDGEIAKLIPMKRELKAEQTQRL